MQVTPRNDAYSAREIALAAGVAEADVVAIVGRGVHVPYATAIVVAPADSQRRIGVLLETPAESDSHRPGRRRRLRHGDRAG